MLENFLGFLVFKDMVPSYNIALQCAKEVQLNTQLDIMVKFHSIDVERSLLCNF